MAIGVSLLAMALFAMGLTTVQPAINRRPLTAQAAPSVWVLSDTHFIAPSLHDGGQAWRDIQATAAGKELRYQPWRFARWCTRRRPPSPNPRR
nr:hypothetical protein [Lacticaseibacillus nasuensis]